MDEERTVPEQRQRLLGAAAGIEQNAALVRHQNLRLLAPAGGKMRLELFGKIVDIDDRRPDSRSRQPVEHVIDAAVFPASGTSGFGMRRVKGRMRSP